MDPRVRNREVRDAIETNDLRRLAGLVEADGEILKQMTPFGTWLHVAASAGHIDVVRYLVKQGLDPNARGGTFESNPIKLAASAGHLDVVEILLALGAELDISEPERNPLFGAIYGGHKAVVALLLKEGIDKRVCYTGEYMVNMDAEAFARERGQFEIAELIRYAP